MADPGKTIHVDQRYLEGLLQNDRIVVREIYDRFAGKIKTYVVQNSGSEEDAADIMQESLIEIYNMAGDRNLQLTCPFEAFLLLICKRKWLNHLRKKSRAPVTNMPAQVFDINGPADDMVGQWQDYEQRKALFDEMFERLSEKCREVIQKSLSANSQEELAQQMGVSYGYLRKKKSECMGTLVQLIKNKLQA